MQNLSKADYTKFSVGLVDRVNKLIAANLLDTYPIRFSIIPHFTDRLMDRNASMADLRSISEVFSHILNKEICMLLYAIHLEDSFRISFQKDQLLIGLTLNKSKTRLVIRTVIFDRNHEGKQKCFLIKCLDT